VKPAHPGTTPPWRFAATDGGLFSLYSLDLAGSGSVIVTGTTATSGTVTQQFDVSSPGAFQTFTLPATFSGLVSVSISDQTVLLTNLAATETLRPGVSLPISGVLGTMPAAPQNIVFADGSIAVNGITVPLYAISTSGAGSWGVFNGTPFSLQNDRIDGVN